MSSKSAINVTVLLLEGGLPSTAVVVTDILGSVGVISSFFNGREAAPYFHVTTASQNGGRISAPFSLSLMAEKRIDQIENPDLVVIPAVGIDIDLAVARNRSVLSCIREQYGRGSKE